MTEAALDLEPPMVAFLRERLPSRLLGTSLADPLCEFLARPGKQIRARLVELSWTLAGGRGTPPAELMLAVELLHAGSLIVDDIEDCATERRGAPALHVKAGLPIALNAGNWLYFAALELLSALPLDDRRGLRAMRRAATLLARCHEGQALDVGVRVSTLAKQEVPVVARAIAERKTGGLASLCTTLAATAAGAAPHVEESLATFGVALGLGLQALDDSGSIACDGRRAKGEEDLRNGRATWAWAIAAEESTASGFRRLQQLSARVEQGAAPAELFEALRTIVGERGKTSARALLSEAIAALQRTLGASRALDQTAALVRAMEESYG